LKIRGRGVYAPDRSKDVFFKASLRRLYLEDERPWLVGFSGGKEFLSTEDVWAYLLQNPNPRGNRPRRDTPWRVPTPAPATVSAQSTLTPAHPVVATAALAAGRARWLSATRPAKDCSPFLSWPVWRLIKRRPGVYTRFEISAPSDQPKGLRRGFAFMAPETGEMSMLTFVDPGSSHTLSVIMFRPGML
jgi:hypothetical protein